MAVSSRNALKALGWKQNSSKSVWFARLKKLGKKRKICLVNLDYKREREIKKHKKQKRKAILGNLGREAELRQNGECLQCEKAHKVVVLHMGGEARGLPPLGELEIHQDGLDRHIGI